MHDEAGFHTSIRHFKCLAHMGCVRHLSVTVVSITLLPNTP